MSDTSSPRHTSAAPAPAYTGQDDIHIHDEKSPVSSTFEQQQQPRGTTGAVTVEGYISESQRQAQAGNYQFRWSSLWSPAVVNPINGKSHTFPIFRIWDAYSTAFWLATLGFFVAFFGWFAAAALMTEAIKVDLNLTASQVADSNMASLGGAAIVRVFSGYFVDRFGPRKVMAALLIIGAIPTGLMPTVSSISGLEAIRFFISILGGTFVPCQAWTTTFFDKSIVGTANAFAGGWGNAGAGVVTSAQIGLYNRLKKAGLTQHLAWRICFVVLPLPMLLLTVVIILLFGRDHPAGKWTQRHQLPGTAYEVAAGRQVHLDASEIREQEAMRQAASGENGTMPRNEKVGPAKASDFAEMPSGEKILPVDTAVAEPVTPKTALGVVTDLRVIMCAISYLLSFGLETTLDAALPQLLYGLFATESFTAESAAFAASMYGCLNFVIRPAGGVISDFIYRRFRARGLGVRARVTYMLLTNMGQGFFMLALGLYINQHRTPSFSVIMALVFLLALSGFQANAACFGVYPHVRPKNYGMVSGLIGSCGSIGGILYALPVRFRPGTKAAGTLGTKFIIMAIMNIVPLVPFWFVPLGDAA
ncbi:unnamed protein product [Jaminaea pallidilutea]